MIDRPYLLTDAEVARFIVNGYHIIEPELPVGLNERIARQLDGLERNPGDAIAETVPELWQIVGHPVVQGVLGSLLGHDFEVGAHRHWHCRPPGMGSLVWHQDSTNDRNITINRFLGLYYPREVTAAMGPTVILPGTHFRNAPTDRMQTYTNVRGQVPLIVKAGTVAFTHYDIWHSAAPNTSAQDRHMVKFLFNRTRPNDAPTWNHDPALLDRPTDWDKRLENDDVNNIFYFSNPIGVSQTDNYKEQRIRRQCWDSLMGPGAAAPLQG